MSSGDIVDGTLLDLTGADHSYQDLQNSVCWLEDHNKVQGKTGRNVQRGPVEYGGLRCSDVSTTVTADRHILHKCKRKFNSRKAFQ